MNPLDQQLLLRANGLVGGSPALFEAALLLCGTLPLVTCVAVLVALWWTDPERTVHGPWLGESGGGPGEGLLVSRRRCVALSGAIGMAFILTRLVAFATDLPRPLGREALQVPLDAEHWQNLVRGMTGFGAFPSDHAALFFAMAVGLFAWNRRAGIAGLTVAVLLSAARVVVGFHYPSDMVAGAAMGAALAGGAMTLARGPQPVLDGVVQLFVRRPALMYPLMFVVALDFTQHFRLVFRTVFYFLFGLLGGR